MAAAAVDVDSLRLDVQELENFAATATRPANQARLIKLLGEFKAQLAAAEASAAGAAPDARPAAPAAAPAEEADRASVAPAAVPAASSAGGAAQTSTRAAGAPALPAGVEFVPIQTFAWDQSDNFVSVYVSEGLDNVQSSGAKVNCNFTEDSFDLTVQGLNGKSYRLARKGLDKNIQPAKSKFKVKADRVVLLLKKVPGTYGADHWTDLVPKRKRPKASADDPTAGIMDMMKDMYDSGDDQMKKTIGEAMLKSRQQEHHRNMSGGGGGDLDF